MGSDTKIQWTDHSWNPWMGCTKVSPGCLNCYAEVNTGVRVRGVGWGKGAPRVRTSESNWRDPIRWNQMVVCRNCGTHNKIGRLICKQCAHFEFRRPRVFCLSLGDWLDEEVPVAWLADLLKVIHDTPNLDWQLLTKRPENWSDRIHKARNSLTHCDANTAIWLNKWLPKPESAGMPARQGVPPANIWLGTSVEDQQRADERIGVIQQLPARTRFLSVEPMLGPIDFVEVAAGNRLGIPIHWAIFGGESGHKSRQCGIDWIRDGVRQCREAGVATFVKQLGARAFQSPEHDGATGFFLPLRHSKGGDIEEWPEDLRTREFPV